MNLTLLFLCLFIFLTSSALAKKKNKKTEPPEVFPFPVLDKDVLPYNSSTPFYKFDGIDYDELPKKYKDLYYTCEGEFMRCIRNHNYLHDVCAFLLTYYGWGNYQSLCTLEIRNCLSRLNNYQGLYGTFYSNDLALYQGEGIECRQSQSKQDTVRRMGAVDLVVVPYRRTTYYYLLLKPADNQNSTVVY